MIWIGRIGFWYEDGERESREREREKSRDSERESCRERDRVIN